MSERTSTIDKRTILLKAVADVGKAITSFVIFLSFYNKPLISSTKISDTIMSASFYWMSIKNIAVLSATNSEGGLRMLEKKHQLKVGETGIVGYVTQICQSPHRIGRGQGCRLF